MVAIVSMTLGFAPSAMADSPPEHTGVIERVVAVVGHQAILLSELRARAKPYMSKIEKAIPDEGAQRAAARQEAMNDLLDRLIDETLIEAAAKKAGVTVAPDEIDAALKNIAVAQKVTVPALLQVAADQGWSERDYRDEVRHQIVEGKLLYVRFKRETPRLGTMTDAARLEAMTRTRARWIAELHDTAFIEKRL